MSNPFEEMAKSYEANLSNATKAFMTAITDANKSLTSSFSGIASNMPEIEPEPEYTSVTLESDQVKIFVESINVLVGGINNLTAMLKSI